MATPSADPKPPSFAKVYLLPVLFVFVLPVVGAAFSSYELAKWSGEARENIRARVETNLASSGQAPTPQQRADFEAQLAEIDIGEAAVKKCGPFGFFATPEGSDGALCRDVLQFVWSRRIAIALLVIALVTSAIVALGLWWVALKPKEQHKGFLLGWTALRLFAIPQAIGQGLILFFLSYWVTALLFHFYWVNLVGGVGIAAAIAMALAIRAVFAKSDFVPSEHGVVLRPEQAPALFEHLGHLAEKVGTAPPKNVVVGIDDNFFVTEMPVDIFDRYPTKDDARQSVERLEGRTLFASLSLMRVLERDEMSAILAHELGHFVSGDTTQSRRLNPLLLRFGAYMEHLGRSMTFGVAACLVAFRALFERISREHRRAAEFAADTVSRRVVGPQPAAQALLKVVAYSDYRTETEKQLINAMKGTAELRIADRVLEGFADFAGARRFREDLLSKQTPHPFDTHPPLVDRLRKLEVPLPTPETFLALARRPESSWRDDIGSAQELEQRLWTAFEQRFQENHDLLIALRLQPKTGEEIAHVERYFPAYAFATKKGSVTVSWRGVTLEDGAEVGFNEVTAVTKRRLLFRSEELVLATPSGDRVISMSAFPDKGNAFLDAFVKRWQRHHFAREHAAKA